MASHIMLKGFKMLWKDETVYSAREAQGFFERHMNATGIDANFNPPSFGPTEFSFSATTQTGNGCQSLMHLFVCADRVCTVRIMHVRTDLRCYDFDLMGAKGVVGIAHEKSSDRICIHR